MTTSQTPMTPPRDFRLGEFQFSVLGPDCADEDFAAVTSSEAHLCGIFGSNWPMELTWERNLNDLQCHADEFDEGVAFAWVIRNFLGGYLGCVYLRPEDNSRAGGKVGIWLRVSETHPERVSGLVGLLKSWMVGLGYDPERHHFIYR